MKDLLLFGAVNTFECPESEADDFFKTLDMDLLLSRGEIEFADQEKLIEERVKTFEEGK